MTAYPGSAYACAVGRTVSYLELVADEPDLAFGRAVRHVGLHAYLLGRARPGEANFGLGWAESVRGRVAGLEDSDVRGWRHQGMARS